MSKWRSSRCASPLLTRASKWRGRNASARSELAAAASQRLSINSATPRLHQASASFGVELDGAVKAAIAASASSRRNRMLPRLRCAVGKFGRKRHRLFDQRAGLVVALEIEQRETEIGLRISRARVELHGALQIGTASAIRPDSTSGHAEQMHGVEEVRAVRPAAAGIAPARRPAGPRDRRGRRPAAASRPASSASSAAAHSGRRGIRRCLPCVYSSPGEPRLRAPEICPANFAGCMVSAG